MWWMTTVGKSVWVPSAQDFQFLARKGDAHRLFMAGKTYWLLRGVL
jgi:hypothetical protein